MFHFQLPIAHIDRIAQEMCLTREYIRNNWLKCEDPAPHYETGRQVFFNLKELSAWLIDRYPSDFTDTEMDDQ